MTNFFDLTGKNALIVGGAGGLGKLVAQAFAEAGANVCIASRTDCGIPSGFVLTEKSIVT